MAQRVQELLRYRSEFFGKLHEILGNHPDIRVVGDRFVFQSELSAKVCRRDGLGIKFLAGEKRALLLIVEEVVLLEVLGPETGTACHVSISTVSVSGVRLQRL